MPKILRLSGAFIAFLFGFAAFASGVTFVIKSYYYGPDYMALAGMLCALYMGIGWIMITVAYFAAKGKFPL